ncbi:MAG TPA: PRC-barrel domain-containing protein [Phenylobacterium sp.]|nr:PRC-barrel domain-containing protein [Phenylobacterium sp.]
MKPIALATLIAACISPSLAAAQPVALGLTRLQLEDADVVDLQGREIGEVERIVTSPEGRVTGLILEIDQRDPKPDHIVQVPLTGLAAVPDRDDRGAFDVQTRQGVAELLSMPAATR